MYNEMTPKWLNFEEKKEYLNWYNQALQDIDENLEIFINLNFTYLTK
jgi:hypothetical protein